MTTPIPFLDLPAQQARIRDDLKRRLDAVLAHCQFVLGPEVAELETELARLCGARHCVSVSSGTDALQIALMAEDIGRGDAVFLPAFTYTATAEVPLLLGATPVFVDVDPRTFQIDPAHLRDRIAAVRAEGKLKPRAVIGVDLFGQPADWPALSDIATAEGLFTLDDLAQSFGATLRGRPLGSQADATATSFFPSKPLGAYGDGGALFTESAERADLYRSLRTHGEGKTRYEVLRTGVNGRLDSIQAAVLLSKLTGVPRGTRRPRAHRRPLRPAPRQRPHHPRPRPRQHQRLGHLRRAAARGHGPRRLPGPPARRGRADGGLLPAPAAPATRLPRPPRRERAAGVGKSGGAYPCAADPSRLDEAAAHRVCDAVVAAVAGR